MFNRKAMDEIRPYKAVHWLWDWNLFWIGWEGRSPRNGFNLLWDDASRGFIIRIGARGFRVRWSRRAHKLFVGFPDYENKLEVTFPDVLRGIESDKCPTKNTGIQSDWRRR